MTSGNATLHPTWEALKAHHATIASAHLRQLFAADPARGERFALQAAGIYFDFSKNRITDETLKLLVRLAEESDLRGHIDAMFAGQPINVSENRAVMHVALRAPRGATLKVAGTNVVPEVQAGLDRMTVFADRPHERAERMRAKGVYVLPQLPAAPPVQSGRQGGVPGSPRGALRIALCSVGSREVAPLVSALAEAMESP